MQDFKTLWQSAKVEPITEKVYEQIPPGVYSCSVLGGSIDLAKERVTLTYQVMTEGAYAKRKLYGNYSLAVDVGMKMLKNELLSLGADNLAVESLANHDALQTLLNTLTGVTCDVTVKLGAKKINSDEHWTNVYVLGRNVSAPKSSQSNGPMPKLDSSEPLPF